MRKVLLTLLCLFIVGGLMTGCLSRLIHDDNDTLPEEPESIVVDFQNTPIDQLPEGWGAPWSGGDTSSWVVTYGGPENNDTSNQVLRGFNESTIAYTLQKFENFVLTARFKFFEDSWGKYGGLIFGIDPENKSEHYRIWLLSYSQVMVEPNPETSTDRSYLAQGQNQWVPNAGSWYWLKLEVNDGQISFYTSDTVNDSDFQLQFQTSTSNSVSTYGYIGFNAHYHTHVDDVTIVSLD